MLFHNLKLILRGLKNNRIYSLLNICGFAIGFAVVLIISLFIYNETTVDHNFDGYKRIYRLIASDNNDCNINYKVAQQLKNDYPEIESVTPVQYLTGWDFNVACDGNFARLKDGIATDNQFFRIFNLKLIEGFSSQPFSEAGSAVISKKLSETLFGDNSPLGKTINIGGFISARITGVVDDFPDNTSFYSDLFINIEDEKNRIMQAGDNGIMWYPANIYVKLKEGSDPTQFNKKISVIKDFSTRSEGPLVIQPLKKIYKEKGIVNNSNRQANTSMIYLFTAIAFLILLLSVSNHVNFTISLQFSRMRETGIKKTHGAGFQQLSIFHITENAVSTLFGFFIALFIVFQVLPYASQLFERDLEFHNLYAYPVNLVIALIIIMVILTTSLAPMYMAVKFDIRKFLSADIVKTRGRGLNSILAVFQATVSIILIVCVLTIYKQIAYAKQSDLGFNKEHLVRIVLPGNFEKGDLVKQELGRFQFIKSASLSMGVPGLINSRSGSGESDNQFWLNCLEVDEDFINTFGLKLIFGRNFHKGEEDKVCILNQTAMKKFGWADIEGKTFKGHDGLQVIGVVNDFSVSSVHSEIEPAALIFKNRFMNALNLKLNPGNTEQQLAQLQKAWDTIIPEYMFDYTFYDQFFNSLYQKEEQQGLAVAVFSVLALIITLMGITGLTFQDCIARSKEIGIRKINGAMISEVMAIINKDFIKRIALAFIIAAPVSWYAMHRWLQTFAYKTELYWWIFLLAGIISFGIVTITVTLQSWRAAKRNPVESLRYE
jgi:putative ABC transport system permease protein